jgi:NAD+ kinase
VEREGATEVVRYLRSSSPTTLEVPSLTVRVLQEEEGRKKPRDVNDDRRNAENGNAADGGRSAAAAAATNAMSSVGDEEDDDSDYDDDEYEEDALEEEEEYDIDDLSSENPTTNASSPVTLPHDPYVGSIPPLVSRRSSHKSTQSVQNQPFRHDRDISSVSTAASSIDLNDPLDRFHQPVPRPPRLSSRHSHNDASAVYDKTPVSAPPDFTRHRLSASTHRRRERGEEGDRDHIREPLSVKRAVGGSKSGRSNETTPRLGHLGGSRAFAVLGADSDTSVVSPLYHRSCAVLISRCVRVTDE